MIILTITERESNARRPPHPDPDPGVVLREQAGVHPWVVPLPPTQLRGAPHAVAVDAAELLQAGQDRAVRGGVRRVRGTPTASPRSRSGPGGRRPAPSPPYPPCDAPTAAWPPGARPLLAASQSGNSVDRNVSHCLLPSCSQLVYMLNAPPAGAATEIPLPASVFIALPAVTQLLTSGRGVERVQQNHHVRTTGQEGHRDVPAHRRRRHHQRLVARGAGRAAVDRAPRSRSSARRRTVAVSASTDLFIMTSLVARPSTQRPPQIAPVPQGS